MDYLKNLQASNPLIHCITNTVTVNDCANALLAIGARPVMAEHPAETAEITARADALLINMGSVTASKIEAMKNSVLSAKEKNLPLVLDCVGISSSTLRHETVLDLLKIYTPRIIKGNASEIAALCTGKMSNGGVDADGKADAVAAEELAKRTGAVIAVTGAEDIITDGARTAHVKNGSRLLSKVTGTGCMLGCIMAALITTADAYDAAKYGAAVMGICGETAAENYRGMGTFHARLMDAVSLVTDADIEAKIKAD